MADTTFVDFTTPTVGATWLNEVNDHIWSDTPVAGTTVHNSSAVKFIQSGTGAVATTVQTELSREVWVEQFGAVGDGVTDDRANIQKAIDAVRAAGGGDVLFKGKSYLIGSVASSDAVNNGLLVPYSADELNGGGTAKRVRLIFTTQTRLLAGANNMIVIRFSDSLGAILGFPSIEANSKTGVWGVGLVPESMTQTTACVFQCFNKIEVITRNTDEGIVMQAGPRVASRDSGCWYNEIYHYHFGGKRGRWLKGSVTTDLVANNRNIFRGRVGGNCNTGTQIDAGTSNKDYSNYEGVNTGTSPRATPTAIYVEGTGGTPSLDNSDNEFYGFFEACTRQIDNGSNSMMFYGPNLDESICSFTVRPITILTRRTDGVTKSRLTISVLDGIIGLGHTVTAGASNGELLLDNLKSLRGVALSGLNSLSLIRLTTDDAIELSAGGQRILASGPLVGVGSITTTSATGGIGYATGAGGIVTQTTSKSTGVTLNKSTGEITMNAAALAADTTVSFTLTNSAIAASDYVMAQHVSAGTSGAYNCTVLAADGAATINVRNITAGSLSEAIVLKFVVFKATTA